MHALPTQTSESLPRSFWLLLVGMLVNRIGGFVVPFLALYLEEHEHLGTTAKGAVISAWGFGTILAGLIGGNLVDRWGRKPTMLLGLFGGGCALLGLSLAHNLGALIALALSFGAIAELYRPAVNACIADLVPQGQRARAFGYLTWTYNLGFSISPLLAGWLIENAGYGWLFIGDAATMILAALLIALYFPETKPEGPAVGRPRPWQSAQVVFADLRFRPLLITAFLMGFIVIQVPSSLGLVVASDGFSKQAYGRLLALNGLIIVIAQPRLVPVFESWGRARVLPWMAGLFGIAFATHAIVEAPLAHALVLALWTFSEIAVFPLCNALVADLAPEHLRGNYHGLYWMAWASANVVGPTLGLQVLEHLGRHGWGALLALVGLAAAFNLARLARLWATAPRGAGMSASSASPGE